ncbi:MAG: dehydratase [Gordonia sp.]|nr:dehydratase [Gordonia sp. (in: high G+C Gram-positive bacteria)]
MLYAEDLVEGHTYELGSYVVTRDEILSFAGQWDPQDFHTDDAAAAKGFFGEVIASGIHTLAVFQRLSVLGAYNRWAVIAGRTLRDVQFRSPVRSDSELSATMSVTTVLLQRPDRALVVTTGQLASAHALVLDAEFEMYVRRRPQRLENLLAQSNRLRHPREAN